MCTSRSSGSSAAGCAGLTLVEMIVFIIVVGIGLAGILSVMNVTVKSSADPLVRKQATAIAESVLTEVEQQPFTWCDPQDANVATATGPGGCAAAANDQNNGGGALTRIPATEGRGTADPYDNVADYNNPTVAITTDLAGNAYPAGYEARVTVSRAGGAAPFAALPADAVLKISVQVTGPGGTDVTLVGYRVRHSPNAAG